MRTVIWVVLALGCGGRTPPPEAEQPADEPETEPVEPVTPEPDDAAFEGTVGVTEVERPSGVATVGEVRAAAHDGYDRVVFELSEGGVPGYHLEYVDTPQHRCGSGEEVRLPGDGWLEVRLEPARMHTEAGAATVEERSRTLDLPNLRALEATCDFEGQVTWVLAVGAPTPYRVLELEDPPRLVVDVAHPDS